MNDSGFHPQTLSFEIYSPAYDVDSGGAVVLHQLAFIINKLGGRAHIWNDSKPALHELVSSAGLIKSVKHSLRRLQRRGCGSPYGLKGSGKLRVGESVVVYPEVVRGNPLNARRVCRWLLNSPGALFGNPIDAAPNDLIFHYDPSYLAGQSKFKDSQELRIVLPNPVYAKHGDGPRQGVCYMVRKGKGRDMSVIPQGAILVDHLSHEEKVRVFNRCETFICLDDRTMYVVYAALCGCRAVVVPREGVSMDEWDPRGTGRLGVAYGFQDISRAMATLPNLVDLLKVAEHDSIEFVRRFIARCNRVFASGN